MPFSEVLDSWISTNIHALLFAALALALLSSVLAIAALSRILAMRRRYRRMMMGREELSLQELVNRQGTLIEETLSRQKQREAQLKDVEKKLQLAVAGIGLVRYNAFRETGSDLSFSLALLDRDMNGAVLTSLFGREESRCYGKPIEKGQSSYPLSEEEIQALDKAGRRLGQGRG